MCLRVKEVFDSLTPEQKTVVYFLVGQAAKGEGAETNEEDDEVKHNVFEADERQGNTLMHADMEQLFKDAKRMTGSLKEVVAARIEDGTLAHSIDTTGMEVATGSQT